MRIQSLDFENLYVQIKDALEGKIIERDKKTGELKETTNPLLSQQLIREILFMIRSVVSKETVLSNYSPDFIRQTTLKLRWSLDTRLKKEVKKGNISKELKDIIVEVIDTMITSALLRGLEGIENYRVYENTKPYIVSQNQQSTI